MNLAERYRAERPSDWESVDEWMNFLIGLDDRASIVRTDVGPVIRFSDGSIHRMDMVTMREARDG